MGGGCCCLAAAAAAGLCVCAGSIRLMWLQRECAQLRLRLSQIHPPPLVPAPRQKHGSAAPATPPRSELQPAAVSASKSRRRRQLQGPAAASASAKTSRKKLFVGGLSRSTREEDLRRMFERFGKLASVVKKSGFGFVEYCCAGDAAAALGGMDGAELHQRSLRVLWAIGHKTSAEQLADRAWSQAHAGLVKLVPGRRNRSPGRAHRRRPRAARVVVGEKEEEEEAMLRWGSSDDAAEMVAVVPPRRYHADASTWKDADYVRAGEVVKYVRDGLRVGERFYPFPRPVYILQLVHLCTTMVAKKLVVGHGDDDARHAWAMLQVLTRTRSRQAKEISETLGVVAAVRKAIDAAPGLGPFSELINQQVNVLVPGDGCRPYTAAAMCLCSGPKWRAWSIDPTMKQNCKLRMP